MEKVHLSQFFLLYQCPDSGVFASDGPILWRMMRANMLACNREHINK